MEARQVLSDDAMRQRRAIRRRPLLPAAALAAALVLAACSGGESGPELPPGRVTCQPLAEMDSYRFTAVSVIDLAERDPSAEPTDGYGPEPFKVTTTVEGSVKGDRMEAETFVEGISSVPSRTIVIGDNAWVSSSEGQWTPVDTVPGQQLIAYTPLSTCNAIARDINVSDEVGEPEEVGNEDSDRYTFDALESDFPDRHPNVGGGSDAARLVNEFHGDIWISRDERYITKIDLAGSGNYDNGRGISVSFSYEVFDQGDSSIQIEPPS